MLSKTELQNPDNVQQICHDYRESLGIISSVLIRHGVDYSLVGGLSLKANMCRDCDPIRPNNGTLVDLDAVAFGPDRNTISKALAELEDSKAGRKVFPDLGIEPSIFSDTPVPHKWTSVLSSMRRDNKNRHFLVYRSLEEEVDQQTMSTHEISVNGIPFQSFPKRTILARFETRAGSIKPKDEEKLKIFSQYIEANPEGEPPKELYLAYSHFAAQIREKFPIPFWVSKKYWEFDYRNRGLISGSSGFVYGLIKHFRN